MTRRANTHRTHRTSVHRTIDTSVGKRKLSGKDMYTIDVSQVMTSYNRPFVKPQTVNVRKLSKDMNKLPSLRTDRGGSSP